MSRTKVVVSIAAIGGLAGLALLALAAGFPTRAFVSDANPARDANAAGLRSDGSGNFSEAEALAVARSVAVEHLARGIAADQAITWQDGSTEVLPGLTIDGHRVTMDDLSLVSVTRSTADARGASWVVAWERHDVPISGGDGSGYLKMEVVIEDGTGKVWAVGHGTYDPDETWVAQADTGPLREVCRPIESTADHPAFAGAQFCYRTSG